MAFGCHIESIHSVSVWLQHGSSLQWPVAALNFKTFQVLLCLNFTWTCDIYTIYNSGFKVCCASYQEVQSKRNFLSLSSWNKGYRVHSYKHNTISPFYAFLLFHLFYSLSDILKVISLSWMVKFKFYVIYKCIFFLS